MSDYSKDLRDFVERSHADAERPIGMADATMIIGAADEITSLRLWQRAALESRALEDAEIASLRAQVDALNGDIHQIGQEREALRAQLAEAQEALEEEQANAARAWRAWETLKARLASARKALETISNPIGHFQERAKAEGRQLDGYAAGCLSRDPEYLRGIARAALSDDFRNSDPDAGLPTHEDVRGILAPSSAQHTSTEK